MTDTPRDTPDDAPSDTSRRWQLGILGAIAVIVTVIAIVLLIEALGGSDEVAAPTVTTEPSATSGPPSTPVESTVPTETTTSTETTTPTETTAPSSVPATTPPTVPATSTPPPLPSDQLQPAIYPTPAMGVRYTDPVVAVRAFAELIGYADPVVSEFMQGDSLSGEVTLTSRPGSLETTVFVRDLAADGQWWVIGAATENIVVAMPEVGDVVTSPLEVRGGARAFEGTVLVRLHADDLTEPLVDGFVTGSGGPELGPFAETFDFEPVPGASGYLLFLSESPEDGSVLEFAAIRVRFTG